MKLLQGVVVLAARTTRARAYVQALAHAGLQPEWLLLYGSEKVPPDFPEGVPSHFGMARNIRFLETLEHAAARLRWSVQEIESEEISSPAIQAALSHIKPTLVIYAGAGGQLVPAEMLSIAPFLHIHSGWLPAYRGSTTLYYSILEQGRCACSALLLDPGIDTGPVLARRHYPLPHARMNVDHVYDASIRSDLLVRVVRHYARHGCLPPPRKQRGQGKTYYVIHPVLKHLALLSLDSKQRTGDQ